MWFIKPLSLILVFVCVRQNQSTDDEELNFCLNECGLNTPYFESRSIGGSATRHAPFTGQLRMSLVGCTFTKICTATIVGTNFLMTALHCVMYTWSEALKFCPNIDPRQHGYDIEKEHGMLAMPKNLEFVAQENVTAINPSHVYGIKKLHRIQTGRKYSDVMLLQLEKPIKFTIDRRAACLFQNYQPYSGRTLTFFGFGKIADRNNSDGWEEVDQPFIHTNYVHQVELPVKSPDVCVQHYPGEKDITICAGGEGLGLTSGDSGGALYLNKDGRFYAVGVASQAGAIHDNVTEEVIRRDLFPDKIARLTTNICLEISTVTSGSVYCRSVAEAPTNQCYKRLIKEQMINANKRTSGDSVSEQLIIKNSTNDKQEFQVDYQMNVQVFGTKVLRNKTMCTVLRRPSCIDDTPSCILRCLNVDGYCVQPHEIDSELTQFLYETVSDERDNGNPTLMDKLFYVNENGQCDTEGKKFCSTDHKCSEPKSSWWW